MDKKLKEIIHKQMGDSTPLSGVIELMHKKVGLLVANSGSLNTARKMDQDNSNVANTVEILKDRVLYNIIDIHMFTFILLMDELELTDGQIIEKLEARIDQIVAEGKL